jgi:acetyl esterase/lipase
LTARRDHFSAAFGEHWEQHIPLSLYNRLPAQRYTFIQPAPPGATRQNDVILGISPGSNHFLLADIWEPPVGAARTGLAMIYLHGGLWQALDKGFLVQPLFRRLAGQGHVILDVAYSLSPEANLDRMLCDVKQAIVWMKKHAAEYGTHPERIVLMGVSGGAHLALMAAYARNHPALQSFHPGADISVRGVIGMAAITDLCAFFIEYGQSNPKQPQYSAQIPGDLRPRFFDKSWLDRFLTRQRIFPVYRHANMPGGALLLVYLLGGTLLERPEAYRLGSPLVHVGAHCPPTLLMHGEDDIIINPSQSRRLHQRLRKAGVRSVYIEAPGAVHAFDQYFGVSRRIAPAAQSATYDIERFLALLV